MEFTAILKQTGIDLVLNQGVYLLIQVRLGNNLEEVHVSTINLIEAGFRRGG